MKIFVSGGVKNGKSYYAQHLAKAQQTEALYYIATMKPFDSEDDERVARHSAERDGWGFTTIEQPSDIENILSKSDADGSYLLDSVTALRANEMFSSGGVNENASEKVLKGIMQILNNINNIVIVSDYIYSDAIFFDTLTEKYRKSLAEIDCEIAKNSDVVLEIVATNVIVHKGKEIFKNINEKIS